MNKFNASVILALILSASAMNNLHAAKAKDLYNKSCTACHGTEVFTRADRKVKNMAELKSRVRQCSFAVEAKWFDKDIDAVTNYLNKSFYNF